ncbi:ectonucleotide pyrophosphatase/phosphodiesterase [Bacteriovoracaceae bacterium]|nr:ectonucleotide pyrophosphatase/phosphodiesterase [Bacteriovoracaceae bacterium]|tara:strand:- start:92493 stop:93752 length:1260 start_codon:yes stop_codon:yes gene_type:complete
MKNLILIACLVLTFSCETRQKTSKNYQKVNSQENLKKPYVLMISLDGYRYDYTKMYQPKNLSKFKSEGTYSKGLIPIFPSKTFPNHYSIVTGMRANKHGIVANSFWDTKREALYKLGDSTTTQDGSWYQGTPLWIAAENQGMVSASFFWVGSDADIQGKHPTYYYDYDGRISHEQRVDQVVDWFKMPEAKRPHLVTLYFSDVDSAGHKYGPESKEVKNAVEKVDQTLGNLFNRLKELDIPLNIFVMSDHGMEPIQEGKNVFLSDYIDINDPRIKIVGRGSHSIIYVENNNRKLINELYRKLRKSQHMRVLKTKRLGRRYGYNKSSRTGDLVLDMEAGYYMYHTKPVGKALSSGGTHGYDPALVKNMRGIFYAKGPNIKSLGEIKSFENIHIYPMIMKLLDLKITERIDGKKRVLRKILK